MKNYKIIIGSPIQYEELTAEIVIDGEYIALLQKEEGNEKIIVEFYDKKINVKVYFDVYLEALQEAKTLLLK